MPSYEAVRLINIILQLYYADGLTQTEISQRLGISTPKVNRLIQQARDDGYVNITIRTPFQHLFEIETRLKAVFGLQEAIVIPSGIESSSAPLNSIGAIAADFLLKHLRDGDIVAITPGTTMQAIAHALESSRTYQVEFVPMLGAIQGEIESDMNFLATNMAERLGAKSYQLHAPAFVDTPEHCEVLLCMPQVKTILDIARRANIALLGVGTVDVEVSRFVQSTALTADDLKHITDECGGVGEICAHVFDIDGIPCKNRFSELAVGLSLNEIMSIPYRIGVAASVAKAQAIYGALRGGYLHVLVTDEAAAQGVLGLFEQNFRKLS